MTTAADNSVEVAKITIDKELEFDIVHLIRVEHCSCGRCEERVTEIDSGYYRASTTNCISYTRLPSEQQDAGLHPFAMTNRLESQRSCRPQVEGNSYTWKPRVVSDNTATPAPMPDGELTSDELEDVEDFESRLEGVTVSGGNLYMSDEAKAAKRKRFSSSAPVKLPPLELSDF